MEFNDVINNRKSIRSFDPRKTVPDELIKKNHYLSTTHTIMDEFTTLASLRGNWWNTC